MAVIGLILLLPGFCALLFGGALLWDRRIEPDILALVLIGLALGAGGIALLRLAIRGRRS
ncbi:hypothetical protein [Bradyrhizobium sp.]|uniref:hypothetical protein n=1 Tax=Bradyrhizobium sp. TaxID=376 RepID=UPI00345B842C